METIYPSKEITDDSNHQFSAENLANPLHVVTELYDAYPKTDNNFEKLQSVFRYLLGLKALEIQAKKQQYKVEPINWEEWTDGNNWGNIHLTINTNQNNQKEEWQVKSTISKNQFLLLKEDNYDQDCKFYSPAKGFAQSNITIFQKFFVERINLGKLENLEQIKTFFSKLLSLKSNNTRNSYLSTLQIKYGNAYFISRKEMSSLIKNSNHLAHKGWSIKVNKSHSPNHKLDNDCYYVAICDMKKF